MKTYMMTLTPVEPYFFGNEKNFTYAGEDKQAKASHYYIESENLPSQSTLLGALRYLLLPVKRSDWKYTEEEQKQNDAAVGMLGFDPEETRTFGKIKSISPVFLVGEKGIYVPTPFDHKVGHDVYTPFSEYVSVEAPEGEKRIALDYEAKNGITSSFMALCDGEIIESRELFQKIAYNGINLNPESRAMFKRDVKNLKEGFSFGVYVTLDDDCLPQNETVFLGQRKSVFSVRFIEAENNIKEAISAHLQEGTVYCFGDVFADASLYEKSLFSVTKLKTYRSFSKVKNHVRKGATLYRLIAAGSVFVPRDKEAFLKQIQKESVTGIGYNCCITK